MQKMILGLTTFAFCSSIFAQEPVIRGLGDGVLPDRVLVAPRLRTTCQLKSSLPDPSAWGPHTFGRLHYDFTPSDQIRIFGLPPDDPFSISLSAYVRYPATTSGDRPPVATRGSPFPLVLYVHGAGLPPEGYFYVLDRLASHGIIAVSIYGFSDGSPVASSPPGGDTDARVRDRVEAILRHLQLWRLAQDPAGGVFFRDTSHGGIVNFNDRVNMGQVGLAGHSRGGEAILIAALRNAAGDSKFRQFQIKALHAIAPSAQSAYIRERFDRSPGQLVSNAPYFQLLVSNDADADIEGIKTYDRVVAPVKMQAFLYGANHVGFNSRRGQANCAYRLSDDFLCPIEHQKFERILAVAFFRQFLRRDNCNCFGLFNSTATTASLLRRKIYWSFQNDNSIVVKDFEGQGSGTSPERNPLLDRIAAARQRVTGIFTSEANLSGYQSLVHETRGLIVGWSERGKTFTVSVPSNARNARRFSHLQFRAAQLLNAMSNVRGADQDFEVSLVDVRGRSKAFRAGAFGEIPWPFEATSNPKSVLHTIRVPLRCYSDFGVDTGAIKEVQFQFNQTPKGLIALDDIAFSN